MSTSPWVQVLGVAQDGGHPQPGCSAPCCAPAWSDPTRGHQIASLAILDPLEGKRWMVDASPDFPRQLRAMDEALAPQGKPDLAGIILTHAHIGHYAGLMFLGREAIGSQGVPVLAMPRLRSFLETSGPWSQLARLENIELRPLEGDGPLPLSSRIAVESFRVPHRGEYSETVGVIIHGPERAVLYLPDVDRWDRWKVPVEDFIARVDVAYLDATFFTDDELQGRSIDEVPHPRVQQSIDRFSSLPEPERAKIRFIHFNHTNPLLQPDSKEHRIVEAAGMACALEGERVSLG